MMLRHCQFEVDPGPYVGARTQRLPVRLAMRTKAAKPREFFAKDRASAIRSQGAKASFLSIRQCDDAIRVMLQVPVSELALYL
jgi:hypothetical protein